MIGGVQSASPGTRAGPCPKTRPDYVDLKKIDHGAMFEGTKGVLVADFETRALLPGRNEADLTYYKSRPKSELIPPPGEFPGPMDQCLQGQPEDLVRFRLRRQDDRDDAAGPRGLPRRQKGRL